MPIRKKNNMPIRHKVRYAIQASYYMWDSIKDAEYEEWLYLGLDDHIFVFDESIKKRTKLFQTASEAGAYLDKYFGSDKMQRSSFSMIRIVELSI